MGKRGKRKGSSLYAETFPFRKKEEKEELISRRLLLDKANLILISQMGERKRFRFYVDIILRSLGKGGIKTSSI